MHVAKLPRGHAVSTEAQTQALPILGQGTPYLLVHRTVWMRDGAAAVFGNCLQRYSLSQRPAALRPPRLHTLLSRPRFQLWPSEKIYLINSFIYVNVLTKVFLNVATCVDSFL